MRPPLPRISPSGRRIVIRWDALWVATKQLSSHSALVKMPLKPKTAPTRLGILISGRGSNMVALADAVRDGRIRDAEIAIVISDQPTASGIEKAETRRLQTRVVERRA